MERVIKFSKPVSIVTKYANTQKYNAAYDGKCHDGGAGDTLNRLRGSKDKLIYKEDLRPSEYHKLNNLGVGEPQEFYTIIIKEKQRLAKDIIL